MSRVETSSRLSDLRVRTSDPVRLIMSSPVAMLDVGATLQDAAEEMVRNDIGAVLVNDGARTGLLSERDVAAVLGALGGVTSTQIDQTATWDLVWAAPEDHRGCRRTHARGERQAHPDRQPPQRPDRQRLGP